MPFVKQSSLSVFSMPNNSYFAVATVPKRNTSVASSAYSLQTNCTFFKFQPPLTPGKFFSGLFLFNVLFYNLFHCHSSRPDHLFTHSISPRHYFFHDIFAFFRRAFLVLYRFHHFRIKFIARLYFNFRNIIIF